MSDEQLRELARRWAASHDPTVEARFLAERLRVRNLDPARLEIAAYLGHGPAIEALGDAAPVGGHMPWRRWSRTLDAAGRVLLVRLGLEQVRVQRELSRDPPPPSEVAETALEAARVWTTCPCDDHVQAVRAAHAALETWQGVHRAWLRLREQLLGVLPAAFDTGEPLAVATVHLLTLHGGRPLGGERDAVRADLVRWALGAAHAFLPGPAGEERRFLATRLAAGQLDEERVAVAAHAGHEAARALLGDDSEPTTDALELLLGLRRWPAWQLRALAEVAGNTYDPAERPEQGRARRVHDRAVVDCWRARRALRDWAGDPREVDLAPSLADLRRLERVARLVPDLGIALLARVLACVVEARAPDEALVRSAVEAWRAHRRRSDLGETLVSWALHVGAADDAAAERTH